MKIAAILGISLCVVLSIVMLAPSNALGQPPVNALAQAPSAAKYPKRPASGKQFIGLADYYHHSLYGKKTASGQVLKKELLTAAHRTLPFGTRVHVINKRTGRSCVVIINDRGPFTKSKVIDLSHAAADKIGLLGSGTAKVACTVLAQQED